MRRCVGRSNAVRRTFATPLVAAAISFMSERSGSIATAHRTQTTAAAPYTVAALRGARMKTCRCMSPCPCFAPLRRLASAAATTPSSASAFKTAPPSTAQSSTTTDVPNICLLCDTPFSSWQDHRLEHGHVARTAICNYFVMPESSESLMQHLERHIALDFKEVDALTMKKVERRHRRLLAGLLHLVEENVLKDSLPCVSPSDEAQRTAGNNHSGEAAIGVLQVNADRFLTRLLLGESYMRREVIDRTARLAPVLTDVELNAVAAFLMSTRQLARLFDELSLQNLVRAHAEQVMTAALQDPRQLEGESEANAREVGSGTGAIGHNDDDANSSSSASDKCGENSDALAKEVCESSSEATPSTPHPKKESTPASSEAVASGSCEATCNTATPAVSWKLSRDDKASVLLACIGELEHFHRQDRPRSVLSKLAADALVLNVIATHARDNLISELIHEALQRIVEEGTPVWRQHQKQVQQRIGTDGVSGEAAANACEFVPRRGGKHRKGSHHQRASDPNAFTLEYVRNTPLSATSHPVDDTSPSTSPLSLDSAAAEQLISSYITFQDVDGDINGSNGSRRSSSSSTATTTADANGDANALGEPVYMSAAHFAAKHWEPMEAELQGRVQLFRRLPLCGPYPSMRPFHDEAQQPPKE
ncbi:putative mitochondrial RNA editing complex protein MP46,mitochondrial [Leptomonas pyrrhocoris]|uniref:Putative mitochondrial RNA editing complex protein MP46,mitochondrial n=1 Tax=Leptomonas pyrrhocoris TaxID=157538 RepID=A0A0M9G2V9_LEPPY|nr:putative mitochondrial RNA editing complex protein MP46,mitochondrial [Leptomonas pyrrhocoris]KPA81123.1 putative mitochondrial RNA editing complex protein MP46,mitochondrial [Leptomonas pyrrhocoris]|eukprot:XP_015659562.1 putative mitochondrial RNA editing complex protein MP46,mitochondrial [Leptomonas pyrrhocoris]